MIARGAIKNPWVFQSYLNWEEKNQSTTTSATSCSTIVDVTAIPLPEYFPIASEIEAAITRYNFWNANAETKSKFSEFHGRNFKRLKLDCLSSGGIKSSVEYPRNQHML